MNISAKDLRILRGLAERYSAIAQLDVQKQRLERYYRTNAREEVRPVVLIDEVPWGEIRDEALQNVCAPELGWLEGHLRRTLYQWEHFQVDLVVPPVFRVYKQAIWRKGIGLQVKDQQLKSNTGTYISAHAYEDQLRTEDDLAKLHEPEIVYDRASSEQAAAIAREVFSGLLKVELVGQPGLGYNIWDQIAVYRGVDNLLLDLAERPEFMHKVARRFVAIARSQFKQLEEQNLLDPYPILLH
ncbi:MAG: hypothetical protein N3A66_05715, partial [Planctomycetota bacterium]|nr:hypothetical protein [Planctomycetota bacterium]